jgi:hypothetical protein
MGPQNVKKKINQLLLLSIVSGNQAIIETGVSGPIGKNCNIFWS